jgi:tripartite-type tricarboxylate transporter receptor subunit TctC
MKRSIVAAVLTVATLTTGAFAADDYPNRTITLISPNAAGGTNDTLARIFAGPLSQELGQQVIVENRDGGGTVIGTQIVAESKPDGYTLLVGSNSSHSFAPLTKPDLAYDPIADFTPIFNFANVPNCLVVNADLGVKTLKDLVALAKEKPGELNYSSGGVGTVSHFAGAMFVGYAGIADETVHIPYNGGANASVAAAAGEVQFYVGPLAGNMMGVIDAGKVIALAVSGDNRVESLPDVPTFAEAGLPEYTAVGWFGMMVPAGTPPEVIAKLSEAANKVAKRPEVLDAMKKQGVKPYEHKPEDFAKLVTDDLEKYTKLVKDGIVKLQ